MLHSRLSEPEGTSFLLISNIWSYRSRATKKLTHRETGEGWGVKNGTLLTDGFSLIYKKEEEQKKEKKKKKNLEIRYKTKILHYNEMNSSFGWRKEKKRKIMMDS